MRFASLVTVAVFLSGTLMAFSAPEVAAEDSPVVLRIADRAPMTTRNILRVSLGPIGQEDWGVGILRPVYANLAITDRTIGGLAPYIAKGVDADADGTFEAGEYGAFRKDAGTNATDLTAYFDFNGVRWHDGTPMTVMDVMFTLHLASLSPRYNPDLRVLWDRAGASASNFSWNRWLAVEIAPKAWEGEASMAGDPTQRTAIRFRLQAPFARFYESVFGELPILPRHTWELTGGGRHEDFGRLVYPEGHPRAGQGIPVNETTYPPFRYASAETWEPSDADVIGSGPFRFTTWHSWVLPPWSRLDRNPAYFVGRDPEIPSVIFDPVLASQIHPPSIDTVLFRVYYSLGILALRNDEVDYHRGDIPPEYIPDLLNDPAIRVWANAQPGFAYLAHNMRRAWLGYNGSGSGDAFDSGRPFRQAAAYLVDRGTCWWCLDRADSPVSPANTFWHNSSLPRISFNPTEARRILDGAHNNSLARGEDWWGDADGDGWRELPGRGDAGLRMLVPSADYDPRRASAGAMFAAEMRKVGLNVTAVPSALGAIVQAVEARDFDMFVLEWQLRTWDPDFLFTLFHSSSDAPGGLNYPGYADDEFDRLIETSRTEMDENERARIIKWAQGVLMDDRPIEPLYFRTALQATRQDRFVNWTVEAGSLWSFWSWIGVEPPATTRTIGVTMRYDTAMGSEGQQRIEATVRDPGGEPLTGATVTFRILPENGGQFAETAGTNVTGTAGATGTFGATYRAPAVLGEPRDIAIEVLANHPVATEPAQRGIVVTVFPGAARFLAFRIGLPTGDLTLPGIPIPVQLQVRDDTGATVDDAAVRASVDPTNGTLDRTNGTAAEMGGIQFLPPGDLRASLTYRVSLNATRSGYYPAFANLSLTVIYVPPSAPPPPDGGGGGSGVAVAAGVAIAIGGTAAVALVFARARRRKRE